MSKRKLVLVLGVVALVLAMAPGLLAQTDPKDGYWEWVTEAQSRNIPAGSVNDPGSHLTYILDTGVNARKLLNDVPLATAGGTVLTDLQAVLDTNADGELDNGRIIQNFVAITNAHPTMAVTVHFRYFNDNCDDVLDFLVILTCNDTLLFDPFNFEIPGSNGENTKDRFFGPARPGKVLFPMPTKIYGSGRFILTAAASGTSVDDLDDAEILFPYETGRALDNNCNIEYTQNYNFLNNTIIETLNGAVGNVGSRPGLDPLNLHVFNAAQISFNYLIGMQTYAVAYQAAFQSGGVNAWARPAIDRLTDLAVGIGGWPDGDGDFAPTGTLVLGGEVGYTSSNLETARIAPNQYYLRNEVHGGDVRPFPVGASYSYYGAQGTAPFFPVVPTDIIMHFMSVVDDYNGSNNAGVPPLIDHSANISPAATTYVLQIYDNNEDILVIEGDPPLNVSPPVPGKVVELKLVCFCLRTFLTTTIAPGTNVDDLTIQEMADIFGPEVLNGDGVVFDGLLKTKAPDLSGGWIRFVRDNTELVDMTLGPFSDGDGAAVAAPIGNGRVAAVAEGTATFNATGYRDHGPLGASFMTISNSFTKQSGFGALWWNYTVPASNLVSENGDPNFDRAEGH